MVVHVTKKIAIVQRYMFRSPWQSHRKVGLYPWLTGMTLTVIKSRYGSTCFSLLGWNKVGVCTKYIVTKGIKQNHLREIKQPVQSRDTRHDEDSGVILSINLKIYQIIQFLYSITYEVRNWLSTFDLKCNTATK